MQLLEEIANKIIFDGYEVTREEALAIYHAPLDELQKSATKITKHFFNDYVELCCISNGKCGACTEDCKFCSQSRHYNTGVVASPIKSTEEFFKEAEYNAKRGVHRFSVVTAGAKLNKEEVKIIGEAFLRIKKELNIDCCASLGLLSQEDLQYLKDCGMTRYHCNIETSPNFFKQICSTHTMAQKERTIANAQKIGLEMCSGCIIGMGESLEDRADIALHLRKLKVDSCPMNVLNPIPGTPLENREVLGGEEVKRTIAMFRHILPKVVLRLAGGRILIEDYFEELYSFGINAEITGDMLTTGGYTIADDITTIINQQRVVGKIEPLAL